MISETIDKWHALLRGELDGGFDELLHEDCVFWSPVLFRPQRGRELTKMYLAAAYQVFPGDPVGHRDEPDSSPATSPTGAGSFRYTKRVFDGNHAVLEFETTMGDVEVNGVDIITCDDDGMIIEFKVMIRPERALQTVKQQMMEAIALQS